MIEDYRSNVKKAVIPSFNIADLTRLEKSVLVCSCEALKADLLGKVFYREALTNYAIRYWETGNFPASEASNAYINYGSKFYQNDVKDVVYLFGKKISIAHGLDSMFFNEVWNLAYGRMLGKLGLERCEWVEKRDEAWNRKTKTA